MKENELSFVETITDDANLIFVAKADEMLKIDNNTYKEIAEKVLLQLEDRYFYNGTVEVDNMEFYSTFTATMIVYKEQQEIPEGMADRITDIVPVWWQMSTIRKERGEVINDFSFDKFKNIVLER